MATVLGEEYVTVPEAANQLRVSSSTIWRWIAQGDLPAHRVGRRRVVVKKADLRSVVNPVGKVEKPGSPDTQVKHREALGLGFRGQEMTPEEIEAIRRRRLTPEERDRALAALEAARRHAEELCGKRGGKLFPSSWKIINEGRDERIRQLP